MDSERICRGSGELIFDPVEEVGSISPSLVIKNNNYARVILLSFGLPTAISFRLALEHEEWLASWNAISKYSDLEGALAFVMSAFAFFDADCSVSLFGVRTAFEVLEWERGLVHVTDFRQLDSANYWNIWTSWNSNNRLPLDNGKYASIVLDPILEDGLKLFR